MFIERFRRLACRHRWIKIAAYEKFDKVHNIRYGERHYECMDCGKVSLQDSRYDRLTARAMN